MRSVVLNESDISEMSERFLKGAGVVFEATPNPFNTKKDGFEYLPLQIRSQLVKLMQAESYGSTDYTSRACFIYIGWTIGYKICDTVIGEYPLPNRQEIETNFDNLCVEAINTLLIAAKLPGDSRWGSHHYIEQTGTEIGRHIVDKTAYTPLFDPPSLLEAEAPTSERVTHVRNTMGYVLKLLEYSLVCRYSYMNGNEDVTVEMLDALDEQATGSELMSIEQFNSTVPIYLRPE